MPITLTQDIPLWEAFRMDILTNRLKLQALLVLRLVHYIREVPGMQELEMIILLPSLTHPQRQTTYPSSKK